MSEECQKLALCIICQLPKVKQLDYGLEWIKGFNASYGKYTDLTAYGQTTHPLLVLVYREVEAKVTKLVKRII